MEIINKSDKPGDNENFVNKMETVTSPLREKFERHFGLWRLELYSVDKKKGDYESLTVNKPRVYSDKVTEELASGILKFSIPVYKDNKADRSKCSMTEQAVYGLRAIADDYFIDATTPSIQSVSSWMIANRGFDFRRVIIWTDEEGNVVPDIAVWDIRNGYWLKGKRGLKRVCNVRVDEDGDVSDTYGVDVQGDDKGLVKVYDNWSLVDGRCIETVTAANEVLDETDWTEKNPVLTYLPILIHPVGNVPFIQSETFNDTIKNVGQTIYDRNEHIWEMQSRLLSYRLTNVANATHTPFMNIFDSSKGGDAVKLNSNPYKTGAEVQVDVGKGQELRPFYQPVDSPNMQKLLADVDAMESTGAAPPIFYGQGGESATAQGTQLLINAAMAVLKSGKRAIEYSETWTANELIRQVKNTKEDLGELQVQGTDGKGKQFSTKIKVDQLIDDRKIVCTLKVENPLGELQNMGLASEAKKNQLLSQQTILDKVLEVDDPDAEVENMNREEAENMTGIKLRHLQKALLDDGDRLGAEWVAYQLQLITDQLMAQLQASKQGSVANTAGIPQGANPQAMVARQNPVNVNNQTMRTMGG